jgi:hypothetical protein
VFTDELEGGVGADFWNGVDVVAAEEDTKVNELDNKMVSVNMERTVRFCL